ncbi:MAG: hypothetical protein KatS3mg099_239 [Candidatus Parcubacteria bacterium]|nr:MAG: hypothetical protein KatS3mg099_239 [Candidatus Parcubacteria bacterium]
MPSQGARKRSIVLGAVVLIASAALVGILALSRASPASRQEGGEVRERLARLQHDKPVHQQQSGGKGAGGVGVFFETVINDTQRGSSTPPNAERLAGEGAANSPMASLDLEDNFNAAQGAGGEWSRNPELPLRQPVVWRAPPTGGSPPVGGAQQDLVVIPNPQNLPVLRPIRITGYRNILIENLTLKPLPEQQAAAALQIERTFPGIVWIASSTIDSTRADMGAVLLDAPPSAQPTRFVIASSTLVVQDSKRKVGAFAWRGALARFEARDSVVVSDNVGLRLAPQAPDDTLEEALVRNTTLQRSHSRLEQARLLEVWSPWGSALRGATLQNVRVVAQKGVPLGELVYPGHTTKDPNGAPIALRQVKDPKTGANVGVWIFTTPAGKAAVRGVVRYE